uniref:Uncharacterized protein n=1 Tax=Lotharella oceanica TaxID=641309 RepID=A0A7S2XGC5_9EUKA|mmetsp:Transcript_33038/g.61408  ORF Transcript_33038/g.61408 Transcript_33038/m.61408 type:complete len:211 (+) Transcript_33038:545-1177(+)
MVVEPLMVVIAVIGGLATNDAYWRIINTISLIMLLGTACVFLTYAAISLRGNLKKSIRIREANSLYIHQGHTLGSEISNTAGLASEQHSPSAKSMQSPPGMPSSPNRSQMPRSSTRPRLNHATSGTKSFTHGERRTLLKLRILTAMGATGTIVGIFALLARVVQSFQTTETYEEYYERLNDEYDPALDLQFYATILLVAIILYYSQPVTA